MDLRGALWRAGVEEPADESQRLQDLERARMHDGRAVPVKWGGPGIDQLARHSAPLQLRSEEQAGRSCTDNEHERTVGRVPILPLT